MEALVAEFFARATAGERAAQPFVALALIDDLALYRRDVEIAASDSGRANLPLPPLARGRRHGTIRLGYYSADFHSHATCNLMAGLFELHDRRRFEVLALSFGPDRRDHVRERLLKAFDRFVDVSLRSDREVAQISRDLEIDIAVDLKGSTQDARPGIFAHRAAPIQVNYLGYPGTTGAEFIDYIIADRVLIPEENRVHYSERVVYLPHSYQVNDRKRAITEGEWSRAQFGLPQSGYVFCCSNSPYMINATTFDGWMGILRQVNGSALWLYADNATAAGDLRRDVQRRGVCDSRLVFAQHIFGSASGTAPGRRVVSQYAPLRSAYLGQRRFVGRPAGTHAAGSIFSVSSRSKSAACHRAARVGDRHRGTIRSPGGYPGYGPTSNGGHQGQASRQPPHDAAVRYVIVHPSPRAGLWSDVRSASGRPEPCENPGVSQPLVRRRSFLSTSATPIRILLLAFALIAMRLVDPGVCSAADRYEAAVNQPGRSAMDLKRETLDQPAQILRLTGIKPGMRVADVLAGDGYYSELLGNLVGPKGQVMMISNAAFDHWSDGDRQARLAGNRLPNVEHRVLDLNQMNLETNSLDAIVLSKVYHDLYWVDAEGATQGLWPKLDTSSVLDQLVHALKRGGIVLLIDDSAKAGRGNADASSLHRIEEAFARQDFEKRGLKVVASSDLLRRADDPREQISYKEPMLGKTDRFVLVFRKTRH